MTTTQENREPTLVDVIEKIDKLSQNQEQSSHNLEQLAQDQERFNERFSHYQQAT